MSNIVFSQSSLLQSVLINPVLVVAKVILDSVYIALLLIFPKFYSQLQSLLNDGLLNFSLLVLQNYIRKDFARF